MPEIQLSQVSIFGAIAAEVSQQLKEQGLPDSADVRHMNAMIEAANLVVAEFRQPHRPAKEASGLRAWYASDETGLSSKYMAYVLLNGGRVENNHPHDPGDFGRCLGLLKAVPEARANLGLLGAGHGEVWACLIAQWDALESMYSDTLNGGRKKLYDWMKRTIDDVRAKESAGGTVPLTGVK
jgi:hypothetical protein